MDAECDVYTDMSVFGATKRLFASRPFGQTLFDVFALNKGTMCTALSDEQTRVISSGLAHHFGINQMGKAAKRWPDCLQLALSNRRVQKAFLSEHSPDRLQFLQDQLERFTSNSESTFIGAVHQTTGPQVRGIALRNGDSTPLKLDFYINGIAAGCALADQINREVGEHTSSSGLVAFEHTLDIAEAMDNLKDAVLHVFDHHTGTLVCPPKEICLKPQYGAALLARTAHIVEELQNAAQTSDNTEILPALNALRNRLPALEQLSTFSLDQYDLYQQIYSVGMPPARTQNHDVNIGIIIEDNDPNTANQIRASLTAQSHKKFTVLNAAPKNPTSFDLLITLTAGDILDPNALAWFAATSNAHPDAMIIRASSDVIDAEGTHSNPHFIWQFDPLLLAQNPAYAHAFAVKPGALGDETIKPATLWQKVYDTFGDKGFAVIDAPIWSHATAPEDIINPLPLKAPLAGNKLAIIIPTKDALELLKPCVESLLNTLAHTVDTEIIIVDNNSEASETKQWFAEIEQNASKMAPTIRVVEDTQPFNWASINNNAAAQTDADYLLFLNNDTLAIDKGWDSSLRSLLEMDGTGIVGAKLLYEDDTIQHAGVILENNGLAVHEGAGETSTDTGYANRNKLTRRCSAVTGAFLACTKENFDAVGGYDGEKFAVTFNDIDFCLTMNAAGHQCIYSPLITFYHLESKTRGYDGVSTEKAARAKAEHETLRTKWQATIPDDPWYPAVFNDTEGKPFTLLRTPKRNQ
ncbi:glycosyltransferase [Kordiimonas aquimaris]|uniref:glycosyltransferase n=1 Tax=Kordiimonas aquimaris TaxID=707591 RepID=UPI0021D2C440|nr:glycosyltransferase [Kordiimonas aquimaris]